MAIRELFSNGLTPAGTLLIGWVCSATNPRAGLVVGGAAAVVAAALMMREAPAMQGEPAPASGETVTG
jgi:hypothetical protein